jgi:hypothetical protein
LIKTHQGSVHGFLGSLEFSEKGMVHPLQLMAPVSSENCKELKLLFETLFKTSQSANEYLISIINHHIRKYTPYDVYLKSLYEYFRGREITAGDWEKQESLVYPILSGYQRDGYRQILHIAGKYGGALLCDGVGLGKTFIFTRGNDNCFAHLGINSIRGHLIQKERAIEAMMGMAGNEDEMFMSDFDVVAAERVLHDDTLFRETVVQRSRAYVRKREQFSKIMVEFPERQPPNVAAYSLKETYGRLLNKLRKAFDRDDPLLKLPIYYPMAYRRKPAEDIEARKEENRQCQIVGLVWDIFEAFPKPRMRKYKPC